MQSKWPHLGGMASLSVTLGEAWTPLKTTRVLRGPCWGHPAFIFTPNNTQDLQEACCLAPAELLVLPSALMTASRAQHGMVHTRAAPHGAFLPTPFPLPLPAFAASTSLPESKGKLFLQSYLAGPTTNIPREAMLFLGWSPTIWRGLAAVTSWCWGLRAGSGGSRSPHTSLLAWL